MLAYRFYQLTQIILKWLWCYMNKFVTFICQRPSWTPETQPNGAVRRRLLEFLVFNSIYYKKSDPPSAETRVHDTSGFGAVLYSNLNNIWRNDTISAAYNSGFSLRLQRINLQIVNKGSVSTRDMSQYVPPPKSLLHLLSLLNKLDRNFSIKYIDIRCS